MRKPCTSNTVSIALVVAVSNNGVIGREGDMPWRLSDDLKWFKKNTLGKPIIMGRKTFQSIGRALPGRVNIVITRDQGFTATDIEIVRSIDEAIELAKASLENVEAVTQPLRKNGETSQKAQKPETQQPETQQPEICIIGGGEIYAQTIHMADRLYLTKVDAKMAGDTHFPNIDSQFWQITPHGRVKRDEKNTHSCEFFIYERTQ